MTKATAKPAAAPTATATAEAPKELSKMAKAKALRDEIYTQGYDLKGKSQRQVFIERAIAEIGLTKAGANTYFQNLSNAARGEPLYKYNTTEKKPGAEDKGQAGANLPGQRPSRAAVAAAEKQVQIDLSKRYQVLNKKSQPVNSFSAKKAAEDYAAQVKGMTVLDTKAKAS